VDHRCRSTNATQNVICIRCRSFIGAAEDESVRQSKVQHACLPTALEARISSTLPGRRMALRSPAVMFFPAAFEEEESHGQANLPFALLSVAFFIYALPTALEFVVARFFSPWIANVLTGDAVGCLWLATFFKKRRTALLLYLALATCEGGMYGLDLVSAESLPWITDLVPALVIATLLVRSHRVYAQSS
jgi:hypothetical protein